MLNKKISFFYSDPVQKETQANLYLEAQRRNYDTEFVDLNKRIHTDADISVFVSHAQAIPKIFSKVSVIMLHDLGQSHHVWPDFWRYEKWHKFTAGLLPGTFWEEMQALANTNTQKKYRPTGGVYNVGWPKSDNLFNNKENFREEVAKIRKRLNLKYDKTILYAPASEIDAKAEEVVEALRSRPYNILLKHFPWDENFKNQQAIVEESNRKIDGKYDNVYIVDPKLSIFHYLGLADVILSDESSALVEALLLEVPSIAVTGWRIADTVPPRMPVAPYDHCIKIRKAEISETVDEVIEGNLTCTVSERFKTITEYRDHWFSNLGKATSVAMDKIEEIAEEYEQNFKSWSVNYGSHPVAEEPDSEPHFPTLVIHESAIDYSDGSESLLFNLCSHPEFDENSTWQDFLNWELYYHLSPLRRNLFNWIDFGASPFSFLELGAGCGALTSHLVDLENAKVTAVEGSVARARVIQQRCRRARNLEIHVSNLIDFPITESFDFVSLIGVLEYAGRYVQSEDPFKDVLTFAHNALKEEGVLLLAIENQIGHKYLAGFPEDHGGRRFEGISNYPHYDGMRTFDAATLKAKLASVGLEAQTWFYPFPDYKMPTAVLSDAALKNTDFDPFSLMRFPTVDRSCRVAPLFNERGYLQILRNVSQMHHFMNSFFVVASKSTDNTRFNLDHIVAAKPNVQRAKPFRTKTLFVKNESQHSVEKSKLEACQVEVSKIGTLALLNHQKYHHGFRSLHERILDGIFATRLDQAWDCLSIWIRTLEERSLPSSEERIVRFQEFCADKLGTVVYDPQNQDKWISGTNLDSILSNILVSDDGKRVKWIDQEWTLFFDIPLDLIYDRALYNFSVVLRQNLAFIGSETNPTTHLPIRLHDRLQNESSRQIDQWSSFHTFEHWFQKVVSLGSFNVRLHDEILDEDDLALRFFRQGQELLSQNKIWPAIDWFSRIRLLKENDSATLNELGTCYFRADLPELALEAYLAAVKDDPNNRFAVLNLGMMLRELGHYKEALKILSSFARNHTNEVEGLLLMADIYKQAGDDAEALQMFTKVLRIEPLNQTARDGLQLSYT